MPRIDRTGTVKLLSLSTDMNQTEAGSPKLRHAGIKVTAIHSLRAQEPTTPRHTATDGFVVGSKAFYSSHRGRQ